MRPIQVHPDGDKVIRRSTQSAKIEPGRLFLPRASTVAQRLPGRDPLQFPRGTHDDLVDALSPALEHMSRKKRQSRIRQL